MVHSNKREVGLRKGNKMTKKRSQEKKAQWRKITTTKCKMISFFDLTKKKPRETQ